MNEVCERLVKRWEAASGRPLSGQLIDPNKTPTEPDCMCAQGWALFESGMTTEEIQEINQVEADIEVSKRLEISLAHSVLLRKINDSKPGSPSVVLTNPAEILGDQADLILKFWHHLDSVNWDAARDAASAPAWAAARDAAWDAARDAARDAASAPAWAAAWAAAANATLEIQGQAVMRERGIPFFFLPLFGFASPDHL